MANPITLFKMRVGTYVIGQKSVNPKATITPRIPNFAAARTLEIFFFAMAEE
jgi:hypothetical protein